MKRYVRALQVIVFSLIAVAVLMVVFDREPDLEATAALECKQSVRDHYALASPEFEPDPIVTGFLSDGRRSEISDTPERVDYYTVRNAFSVNGVRKSYLCKATPGQDGPWTIEQLEEF